MWHFRRFTFLLILLFAGCGSTYANEAKRLVRPEGRVTALRDTSDGVRAPDFTLEQLNGKTFRLSAQRGKIIVLNFWATWCGPCRKEIPALAALQEEMQEHVLILGVSLDKRPPAIVRVHANKLGINYPVVMDDGTVRKKYGPLPGIPTTFIIDRAGRVRLWVAGTLTKAELRPVLQALSEGKPLAPYQPPFRPLKED